MNKKEKLVYIVISHIEKFNDSGKYIHEKVYLGDVLTNHMRETASLIIDVKNRKTLKSDSMYESLGLSAVVNHYTGKYSDKIVNFYKDNYNIEVEVQVDEIRPSE